MPETVSHTRTGLRPTRRSRDPEATRRRILKAAEALFIEHGFSRVPVSWIAREAGVAKSLIHHYFKNKEELWREVKQLRFEAYIKPLIAALRRNREKTSLELLQSSMQDLFRFLDQNRELARLISWMDLEYDADIIYDYHDLFNLGITALKERQKTGSIRADIDPKLALVAILNMIIHWFQARPQWLNAGPALPDRPESDQKYLETVLTIFFEGIIPRPPKSNDSHHPGPAPAVTGTLRETGDKK